MFLAKNGVILGDIDIDDAYDLVIAIADRSLRDVTVIARKVRALNPH